MRVWIYNLKNNRNPIKNQGSVFPFLLRRQFAQTHLESREGKHATLLLSLSLKYCFESSTPHYSAMGPQISSQIKIKAWNSWATLFLSLSWCSYLPWIIILFRNNPFLDHPTFHEATPSIHINCSSPNPSIRVHLPKSGVFSLEEKSHRAPPSII